MRRDPRRVIGAWKPTHLRTIPHDPPFSDLCRIAGACAGHEAFDLLRYFAHSDRAAARAAAVQGIEYLFETTPAFGEEALRVLKGMRCTEKVQAIRNSVELLINELNSRRRIPQHSRLSRRDTDSF